MVEKATHDAYVVPYISYASGIKSGEGGAIIVKPYGTLKDLYPLRWLNTGTSIQRYWA